MSRPPWGRTVHAGRIGQAPGGTAGGGQGGGDTSIIEAVNDGPSQVMDVTVIDLLPPNAIHVMSNPGGAPTSTTNAVTFRMSRMLPGQLALLDVVVRPSSGGTIKTVASTDGMNDDPDASNNTATGSIIVIGGTPPPMANLSLSSSPLPGQTWTGVVIPEA